MAEEETHEKLVEMFIEGTNEIIGKDCLEDSPEWPYETYEKGEKIKGVSYPAGNELTRTPSPIVLDEKFIKLYCQYMGFTNPLFTDPEYAKKTRYGSIIAPGIILWEGSRTISSHGVAVEKTVGSPKYIRPNGYPIANFISGCAWEWYDVVRAGDRTKTTKSITELVDKKGAKGRLLFSVNRVMYWTNCGDLLGTATGTTTMAPRESMGTTRSMDVKDLGKDLMYTRGIASYTNEDVEKIVEGIESETVRGSQTRYWEDVEVGDKISPIVLPPATIQDFMNQLRYCASSYTHGSECFDAEYKESRERFLKTQRLGHVHPVTNWPYGSGDEHDDSLMAPYRAQPAAFDQGRARLQYMGRCIYNWMGDEGFLRRMYGQLRKTYYYGDAITFGGEVVKKFTITEEGAEGPGAVGGKQTYYAVGIKIEGKNQLEEDHCPGMARVYLPSREHGPVKLPIPHPTNPTYVPFEEFRKDFY